jgi:hypothetical protein
MRLSYSVASDGARNALCFPLASARSMAAALSLVGRSLRSLAPQSEDSGARFGSGGCAFP